MTDKKRHLTEKIEALLELFPVVAIIGPRQCGKSTLAAMLRPKWKYYDLERPDDFQLVASDPLGFFSLRPQGVIIDEIQQYPELFKVLRGVIDSDRGNVGRYLVTGSSSPEIVRGLSERLAGRIATVELWPFKISEFHSQPLPRIYSLLTDKNVKIDELLNLTTEITVNQVFDQWMNGGYPEPRIKSAHVQAFHGLWMDEYFSDYIRRDIQRLFPRINSQVFRLFINTLSFQSGNIINHSDTARSLEVSSVTTKLYFEILHNTFVWRNLRSYQGNRLKTIQKSSKGFFRDSGLLHHQLKIIDLDQLLVHPTAGTSFEAFIIEEIIRGFQCTMASGMEFFYYRTKDKSEIDLIIDAPFGLIPIEVRLGHKINKRGLMSLKNFIKDTQTSFGILVNNAEKIDLLSENIIQIPASFL